MSRVVATDINGLPVDTLLEDLKNDLVARLEADPFFAQIHIIAQDEGDLDKEVEIALAGRKAKNGGKGAAVIIHAVDVVGAQGNMPLPHMQIAALMECTENYPLNRSTGGTGIPAAAIAARVVNVLNHYVPFHLGLGAWHVPEKPLQELSLAKGMVGYALAMMNHGGFAGAPKVNDVQIENDGGEITMTTGTAGASIYYTTDGTTYPSPHHGALLYTAALTAPAQGFEIRAAAYKDAWTASNVAFLNVEAAE